MKDIFDLLLLLLNKGLITGLSCLALRLLSPLLKRVLSPQQRAVVWATVWIGGYMVGRPAFLPITFQDLAAPRLGHIWSDLPAFLPGEYLGEGPYHVALPGGALVRVPIRDWFLWGLVLLWLAGVVVLLLCYWRRRQWVRDLASRSRRLERNDPLLRGEDVWSEDAAVWLCPGLSTSFVSRTQLCWGDGPQAGHQIFLQEELAPERLKLVLRHEVRHIRLCHCWWKCLATLNLILYWWNPLVWLGFRTFCRDLELACDQSVLKKLAPDQRREYARMLLELGTGCQLWEAPLSFAECDGALRVRAAAGWRAAKWRRQVPTWAAALILGAFLIGGHWKLPPPQDMVLAWERETGSADRFALALGTEMSQVLFRDPEHRLEERGPLDVEEVWEAPEDYPRSALWVRDGKGGWYHVCYAWWGMDTSFVGVMEAEPVSAPELEEEEPIYRK